MKAELPIFSAKEKRRFVKRCILLACPELVSTWVRWDEKEHGDIGVSHILRAFPQKIYAKADSGRSIEFIDGRSMHDGTNKYVIWAVRHDFEGQSDELIDFLYERMDKLAKSSCCSALVIWTPPEENIEGCWHCGHCGRIDPAHNDPLPQD